MMSYYLMIFTVLLLSIGLLQILKKYNSIYKFVLSIISILFLMRIINFGLISFLFPFLEAIIIAIFFIEIVKNN